MEFLLFAILIWVVFWPKSFGKDTRKIFEKIKNGWEETQNEK